MNQGDMDLTSALRRAGIAASSIREAIGPFIVSETERIIAALAVGSSGHMDLLAIQADAKALFRLKKQLEAAMTRGNEVTEA